MFKIYMYKESADKTLRCVLNYYLLLEYRQHFEFDEKFGTVTRLNCVE